MSKYLRWLLPLFLLLVGSGTGFTQSMNAGDLRGTVTDPSGALVPGVTVTVVNVDTGVSKTFTTNNVGLYDTSSIVAGNYQVTFSKTGFQELIRGPITLQVGFTTVNAQLSVGSTSTEVTVNTDVPLLGTESGDLTTTLDFKSMAQLPQVGQDWQNFMILLPGATGTPSGNQGSSNPGQAVSVNGTLPFNNVIADGASTTLSHSQNANPAVFEDTDELQVSLSSFSAQYGVGGSVFNQISKGGTDHFHGSAYDYLQNDYFNAAQYGFGVAPTVPFLRYNNFGGNIGGPVALPWKNLKKKAFFFFGYDQTIQHGSASNQTNSIPSTNEMAGNFTGEFPIYDPTTQVIAYDPQGNPYPVRQSFQSEYGSNGVPSALIDPVAAQFQKFYPTPSNHIAGGKFVTGTTGSEGQPQNNFYSSVPQSTPYRKYFGRLDYDITSNNRLTMSDTQSDTPVIYPNGVTACPIGCQAGDVDNNNAQITDVWNINPKTINEARIGYTWQGNFFSDLALGKGYATQLGWQFAKADDFPAIQFYRNYPYAWIQPSSNAVYKEHVFDPSDVVTMIRGKHILHFGGEILMYQDNSTAWGNTNAGTLGFGGAYTENWTHAACGPNAYVGQMCPDSNTGLEYADFLLGTSSNWSANVSPEYGARFKSPQMFIQDDYKVRPNLTVNLGLRYQINHGWSEVRGNEASFDPTVINPTSYNVPGTSNTVNNPLGAYWFGTTAANGRKNLIADVYNTWMPRVGASWQPTNDMTVRGGIGLYAYNWSLDNYGGNNSSYGMGAALGQAGSTSDQTNGITP
ncbi:MAG: carboxypeptidase-like regulatory domain-containing protein, partial [Terracidiphilus sp.]